MHRLQNQHRADVLIKRLYKFLNIYNFISILIHFISTDLYWIHFYCWKFFLITKTALNIHSVCHKRGQQGVCWKQIVVWVRNKSSRWRNTRAIPIITCRLKPVTSPHEFQGNHFCINRETTAWNNKNNVFELTKNVNRKKWICLFTQVTAVFVY